MDNGEPDVLGKMDALLTRHRTGAPTPKDLALAEQQAGKAAIPVLTEIIAEPSTIPVLTDAVTSTAASKPETPPSPPAQAVDQPADDTQHEDSLRQMEDLLVQELENRISLEFAATLDRALNELLERSREHIRHVVREALRQRVDTTPPNEDPH
ncbi:MAG: hypothetical protein PHX38_11015 [Sulfuricella sp.]|nr:hypothetical protein [Sulfuricella sp.]